MTGTNQINNLPEGYFANVSLELKQTLSRVLKGYNRHEVAEQISKKTGKKLSKIMLDKILSSNEDYPPLIIHVQIICEITNNLEPFQCVLKYLNLDVITKDEIELLKREGLYKHLSSNKCIDTSK